MRILLATDGSEYSDHAAAQCGELVSKMKDSVVKIITVSEQVVDFDSDDFVSEDEFVDLLNQAIHKETSEILRRAERIVSYENEQIVIEKEAFIGSAKKLIVLEAAKWKADLIIVGSHGYGFWARAVLGSVSDAVVHHSPCSVLVVRKKAGLIN